MLIRDLVNDEILNKGKECIGFTGIKKFIDPCSGKLYCGWWEFVNIIPTVKETGVENIDNGKIQYDTIFGLDAHINDFFLEHWEIANVINENGEICLIEFHYEH